MKKLTSRFHASRRTTWEAEVLQRAARLNMFNAVLLWGANVDQPAEKQHRTGATGSSSQINRDLSGQHKSGILRSANQNQTTIKFLVITGYHDFDPARSRRNA